MKFTPYLSACMFAAHLTSQMGCQSPVNASPIGDPLGGPNAPVNQQFKDLKIRHQPPGPQFPSEAKTKGIQGDVVVEIWVNESGIPFKAKALAGPDELKSMSEGYMLNWRFEPLLRGGKPQPFRTRIFMPIRLHSVNSVKYVALPKDDIYWALH